MLTLTVALMGTVALAPDALELQAWLGSALALWCAPTLCAAHRASIKSKIGAAAARTMLVGALLLMVLFGSFLWMYRAQFRGALLTKPGQFARAQGTITTSELVYQSGGSKSGASWCVHVAYSYVVAGRPYSSELVDFDWAQASHDRDRATARLQRYPLGARVSVFYWPSDPGFAALNPAQKGSTFYFLCILLVIEACCLATVARALRAWKAGELASVRWVNAPGCQFKPK